MEVVEFSGAVIAGLQVQVSWRSLWEEMPRAWRRLFDRADEFETLRAGPYLDVSLEKTREVYRQLAGFPVRDDASVPPGLQVVRIPPQRLLHHVHGGPVAAIADAFGEIYSWAKRR